MYTCQSNETKGPQSPARESSMSKPRQIVTLLLTGLIALQSVLAVAAPCVMPANEDSQMIAMGSDEHAGHHMSAQATDTVSIDCCDDGYCSQSGCVSITIVPGSAHTGVMSLNTPTLFPQQTTLPEPLADSLLRPPSA